MNHVTIAASEKAFEQLFKAVRDNFTVNLPFAAAFATVPIVVMVIYLLIARRLGAFEHL